MSAPRRRGRGFLPPAVLVLALALAGCDIGGPGRAEPSPDAAPEASGESARLVRVIDGDTIDTTAGTVRLIGVDTPESGQCGFHEATQLIDGLLAPGDPLLLTSHQGQNDHDRYGRLIRYVATTDGVDVAAAQLEAGLAVARYDSTDGYPAHPRESAYHAAQRAEMIDGVVVPEGC